MFKKTLVASALALTLGQAAAAATFTTIWEDDFDAAAQGLNATPFGWTVTDGTVDVIGGIPSAYYDFYPMNGNYIDLDGSTGDAGRMTTTQVFNFVAGVVYRIYFTMGQNGAGTDTVKFGFDFLASSITNTGGIAPVMTDQFIDFSVMADVSSALFFEGVGNDNQGLVIDNVILKSLDQVAAVPLPASAPLILLGLSGLAALRRRRSARA